VIAGVYDMQAEWRARQNDVARPQVLAVAIESFRSQFTVSQVEDRGSSLRSQASFAAS